MEFILTQNLEAILPQTIDFNFEQLKSDLDERLVKYKSMVVSEDGIKDAKKDRANLNKLSQALDGKRKDIKAACLKPYEDVERKTKELTGMIGEAISNIDNQVKVFDEQKKEEKYKAITHFYTTNIGDLSDLVPLHKILPDKWANAGTTLISVTQEIAGSIAKIRNDLGIIEKMSLDFSQQITDVYLKTLDMSAALAEKTRLEEQQRILEARKAEQERQREAERQAAIDIVPVEEVADIEPHKAVVIDGNSEPTEFIGREVEQTKDIDVRFYATTDAFRREMKALTEKHVIKYGRVR